MITMDTLEALKAMAVDPKRRLALAKVCSFVLDLDEQWYFMFLGLGMWLLYVISNHLAVNPFTDESLSVST